MIITTNMEFERWTEIFGDERLTSAPLDRLTHKCHILEMSGESYRFKESLRRRQVMAQKLLILLKAGPFSVSTGGLILG